MDRRDRIPTLRITRIGVKTQMKQEKAFLAGRDAYATGKPRSSNPHALDRAQRTNTSDLEAAAWDTGWRTEERNAQGRSLERVA